MLLVGVVNYLDALLHGLLVLPNTHHNSKLSLVWFSHPLEAPIKGLRVEDAINVSLALACLVECLEVVLYQAAGAGAQLFDAGLITEALLTTDER